MVSWMVRVRPSTILSLNICVRQLLQKNYNSEIIIFSKTIGMSGMFRFSKNLKHVLMPTIAGGIIATETQKNRIHAAPEPAKPFAKCY
jgi:hypothetical protein